MCVGTRLCTRISEVCWLGGWFLFWRVGVFLMNWVLTFLPCAKRRGGSGWCRGLPSTRNFNETSSCRSLTCWAPACDPPSPALLNGSAGEPLVRFRFSNVQEQSHSGSCSCYTTALALAWKEIPQNRGSNCSAIRNKRNGIRNEGSDEWRLVYSTPGCGWGALKWGQPAVHLCGERKVVQRGLYKQSHLRNVRNVHRGCARSKGSARTGESLPTHV